MASPHRLRSRKKVDEREYISIALSRNFDHDTDHLYSDNEEIVSSRSLASGSVKKKKKKRFFRRKKQSEVASPVTDEELDELINSFAKKRDPNLSSIIIPSQLLQDGVNQVMSDLGDESVDRGGGGTTSSYYSGFSSACDDDDDDEQSQTSFFRKLIKRRKKKAPPPAVVPDLLPPTKRYDNDSVAPSEARSHASSIFGFSVSSMSISKLIRSGRRRRRRKKKNISNDATERTDIDDVPSMIGESKSKRKNKKKYHDNGAESDSGLRRLLVPAKPQPRPPVEFFTDFKIFNNNNKENDDDEMKKPILHASSLGFQTSSIIDALQESDNELDVPDFEPRLEDPKEPLLQSDVEDSVVLPRKPPVFQILNMELVVDRNTSLSKDDISTLSDNSIPELPTIDTKRDDYKVYDKSKLPTPTEQKEDALYAMPYAQESRNLSILLIQPAKKIFEIVTVGFGRATTVSEAIEAAKSSAVDKTLAKQNYTSLCSDAKVLSLTSLVSKLKTVKSADPRREMERTLLVAVPEENSAMECQKIRRMLWKNPKLQSWWRTQQVSQQ